MNRIDLKEEVRRALRGELESFAASHPRLAAVLDETLLVEQASASLADDDEYRSVMAESAAAGVVAETAGSIVRAFVKRWLRDLL